MTDFVDRLLGRSELRPIRPLLPTVFEPSGRAEVVEPTVMGEFTTATGAERSPNPAEVVQFPLPNPAPDASAAAEPAAPHPARPDRSDTDGRISTQLIPDRREPIAVTATPAPGPHHRHADPIDTRVRIERHDLPAPPATPAAPTPTPARLPEPTSPAPIPVTPQVHSTRPPKAFRQAFVGSRDRAREPDVHISIGRVEIKAASSTAAPPGRPDTARRPKLTLDDYLKSRES